jgi:RsiW-degrading membrane proteinase PrsW (M82 family)
VILNRGNVFSLLITAFMGAIFLLMVFETWALFTGNKPISDYVREAVRGFPGWAFAIAILVGIIVGHFLWGPATGRLAPAPRRLRALSWPGASS